MKNIVQVVTTMNRGGLETLLLNVYGQLKEDYKFFFIVQKRGTHHYFDEIKLLGGEIIGVYRENFLDYLLYPFRMYFSLRSIDSVIIHSHIDALSGIPLFISKLSGYSVRIAHSHNSSQENNPKYVLKMLLKRMIWLSTDKLLACSYDAGKMMFGYNSSFLFVPNGIPTSKYNYHESKRDSIRYELEIQDKFVIGHVGRFNHQKNHMFLLKLISDYRDINPNVILLLVGDGPLIETIKTKTFEMNLEKHVIFQPSTDRVNLFYSAFDLFVFPSLFEGMPLALLEAQASNLKCIVSEIISNESICNSLTTKLPIDRGSSDWIAAMNFESHDRSIISSELASFLQEIDINRTSEEFRKLYSVVDND
jgi:glycosyltransferase involved in cell wall biosynthesis